MIKDGDNGYGYHLSLEDFYINQIVHVYKHYNYSGVGVKSLVDVFVYLSKYEDCLDNEYLERQFNSLGILEFANRVKSLAFKLLKDNKPLTEQENKLLEYMVESGSHGNEEIGLKLRMDKLDKNVTSFDDIDLHNKVGTKGKLKYTIQRLFPSKLALMERYPFCKNHPYIYWLIHFKRLFDALTINKDRINKEFKDIKND